MYENIAKTIIGNKNETDNRANWRHQIY
jgi:hypothetical protein